jgi:hypothetical protein
MPKMSSFISESNLAMFASSPPSDENDPSMASNAAVNEALGVMRTSKSFMVSDDDPAGGGLPGDPGIKDAICIVSSRHRLRLKSKFRSRTRSVVDL